LFTFNSLQGEVRRRGVWFKCHVFQCQKSGYVLPRSSVE
jgi:hypothetical protein